jgi:Ser/Thr protein kinase RdoA (MazF antagonist)
VLDEAQQQLERVAAAGTLGDRDAALLRRAGEVVRARLDALALPLQAIHGDAHLHNVLNGPEGPLWNDWEDCFFGPRAWDLGCLHAAAQAFGNDPVQVAAAGGGYGAGIDADALDACIEARRLQGTVWSLVMAAAQPGRRARAEHLLEFYRRRGGSSALTRRRGRRSAR